MFLVRWAAIALVALEAAAAALYSFLLASVAAAYCQTALLIAVVVIYVVVPAAIAVGAARRRFWWLWAGVAYQLAWAFLLTPVMVGLEHDVGKAGIVGAILFPVPARGQRRRRPRRA